MTQKQKSHQAEAGAERERLDAVAEALAQREQNLSDTIINSISGSLYLLDEHGRYTRWNAYHRDVILGLPDDQIAGMNAIDTIHPEDRDLIQARITNVLQNGKEEIVEGRVLLHGGPAFIWMLLTGRRMMIAGRPFLVGNGVDITERKQADEALRAEKTNSDAIFESSPVAMFVLDKTTNIVRVNAAAVALTGGSAADIMGHRPGNALRCVHSSKDPRGCGYAQDCPLCPVRNGIEDLLASGGTLHGGEMALYLIRDGAPQKVWVRIGAEPVQMDGRRHLCVAMEDITESKQSEDMLHQRIECEKLLHEVSTMALIADDLAEFHDRCLALVGERVGVDRAYFFMHDEATDTMDNTHEWCAEGIAPQKDKVHIPGSAVPWWLQTMRRNEIICYSNIEEIPDEAVKQILSAQDVKSVLAVPLLINGQYFGFLGFDDCARHRDWRQEDIEILLSLSRIVAMVTERKRAEAALLRLSTAIEQASEIVFITDAKGVIQYVNPAFEKITGYSAAEAIGGNPRMLKSGKHDALFYSNLWGTLLAGKRWKGDFINKRKDGSLYTEEATLSPLRETGEEITGYVAIKRDITDELEREEMFRQSQKMDAVGQLTGGIAHDFNNMLQVIQGFAELLLGNLAGTSRDYQNAKEIEKAAKLAAELTRKLLAFSRKQPVDKIEINLNDTIQDSKVLLLTLLGESIRIDLRLAGDLRPVYVDHGQMTQVIMNLAVNARDAMPAGGRLTLATDNVILSKEDAAALPDVSLGAFVCLSVTDTGCGMSKEVRDHLFEPFFTTKEVGKGTGLGLAVVYGIVKQNKGWIHLYSEEGHGTCVKVYLPALADKQTTPDGGGCGARKNERILLVEDDPDTRNVVIRLLKTADYQVTAVASAEEALTCYTQTSGAFDLLFSDMVLPGKSGLELADALQEKSPCLPVLLYSGYCDQRERWESMDRKGYRFLQKPFTSSTLLAAVYETLGK